MREIWSQLVPRHKEWDEHTSRMADGRLAKIISNARPTGRRIPGDNQGRDEGNYWSEQAVNLIKEKKKKKNDRKFYDHFKMSFI